MIIAFMGLVAALVLLVLTPSEGESGTRPSRPGPSPWLHRAAVAGACIGLVGFMFVLAGGVPEVMARETVSRINDSLSSQVGAAVSQHAHTLQESDLARAAIVQQSFGAAMLLAFAVMWRNRRR